MRSEGQHLKVHSAIATKDRRGTCKQRERRGKRGRWNGRGVLYKRARGGLSGGGLDAANYGRGKGHVYEHLMIAFKGDAV